MPIQSTYFNILTLTQMIDSFMSWIFQHCWNNFYFEWKREILQYNGIWLFTPSVFIFNRIGLCDKFKGAWEVIRGFIDFMLKLEWKDDKYEFDLFYSRCTEKLKSERNEYKSIKTKCSWSEQVNKNFTLSIICRPENIFSKIL